jgi:autonomous glycyl radical cofactor GrcA
VEIEIDHVRIQQRAEEYNRLAEDEKKEFLAILCRVADELGLVYPKICEPYAVKTVESLVKKLLRKWPNLFVTDALRFTLIINSPKQLNDVLRLLRSYSYNVWSNPSTGQDDIANRLQGGGSGYKDIAIKLVKSSNDELVKELQLIQKNMFQAKYILGGHQKYKAGQDTEDFIVTLKCKEIELQKRSDTSVDELQQLRVDIEKAEAIKNAVEQESKELYDLAYQKDNP